MPKAEPPATLPDAGPVRSFIYRHAPQRLQVWMADNAAVARLTAAMEESGKSGQQTDKVPTPDPVVVPPPTLSPAQVADRLATEMTKDLAPVRNVSDSREWLQAQVFEAAHRTERALEEARSTGLGR